mmetsp:Transcript_13883/g.40245  ORF Transcript_13883/g.40245 Transcript_13883/m.40245 type:complete len:204 (-) Transcript_13883:387-998(-)
MHCRSNDYAPAACACAACARCSSCACLRAAATPLLFSTSGSYHALSKPASARADSLNGGRRLPKKLCVTTSWNHSSTVPKRSALVAHSGGCEPGSGGGSTLGSAGPPPLFSPPQPYRQCARRYKWRNHVTPALQWCTSSGYTVPSRMSALPSSPALRNLAIVAGSTSSPRASCTHDSIASRAGRLCDVRSALSHSASCASNAP